MASRFWVGGTGTWDAADTTHWSATSGGAGGVSVPGVADTVTFDGSSGGGTVTVNTTISVVSITMGSFAGTIDCSVNNNNVTVGSFQSSGLASRTLKMGSGTWTVTGTSGTVWDCNGALGFTLTPGASTLIFSATTASTRTWFPGSATVVYGTVILAPNSSGGMIALDGGLYVNSLTIQPRNALRNNVGITINTAINWTGTSANQIYIFSSTIGTSGTAISLPAGAHTMTWVGLRDSSFTGLGTVTATNSFDLGDNSGITITPPAGAASESFSAAFF